MAPPFAVEPETLGEVADPVKVILLIDTLIGDDVEPPKTYRANV